MKEWLLRKMGEKEPSWEIRDTAGVLVYRLSAGEESAWSGSYRMEDGSGQQTGTLEWRHEAFRLARMPRVRGYLGGEEVFLVKRELEALQDKIEVEGKDLTVEGQILEGEFRLCREGRCLGRYHYRKGGRKIEVEENEPLNALFALALAIL